MDKELALKDKVIAEQLEKEGANIVSLKAEYRSSKEMIENKHKLELDTISKRHSKELKELEERLKERNSLELSKKDLEINELSRLIDNKKSLK